MSIRHLCLNPPTPPTRSAHCARTLPTSPHTHMASAHLVHTPKEWWCSGAFIWPTRPTRSAHCAPTLPNPPPHPLGKGPPPPHFGKGHSQRGYKNVNSYRTWNHKYLERRALRITNIRKGGFSEPQIFRKAEKHMFGKAEPQI